MFIWYFPPDFKFLPINHQKPSEFHEKIFLKTGSTVITYTQNKTNPQHNDFSKLSVCKLLSRDDWENTLGSRKEEPFKACGFLFSSHFNYLRYQDAWFGVFFFGLVNHSWLFSFGNHVKIIFQNGFRVGLNVFELKRMDKIINIFKIVSSQSVVRLKPGTVFLATEKRNLSKCEDHFKYSLPRCLVECFLL